MGLQTFSIYIVTDFRLDLSFVDFDKKLFLKLRLSCENRLALLSLSSSSAMLPSFYVGICYSCILLPSPLPELLEDSWGSSFSYDCSSKFVMITSCCILFSSCSVYSGEKNDTLDCFSVMNVSVMFGGAVAVSIS